MTKLRIKNWEKYQHYKDRNPPWIKLDTGTFQDYDFSCLQDASKLLAICIWTLAGRSDDATVPADFEWIKRQCNLGQSITIENLKELIEQGFIIDASNTIATRYQNARPETETETETETEIESPGGLSSPPPKKSEPTADQEQAVQTWNDLAGEIGLSKIQHFGKARQTALRLRLKEIGGLAGWLAALEKIRTSDFLRGGNERGWKADFDWVVNPRNFAKIIEGNYDKRNGAPQSNSRKPTYSDELMEAANMAINRLERKPSNEIY